MSVFTSRILRPSAILTSMATKSLTIPAPATLMVLGIRTTLRNPDYPQRESEWQGMNFIRR